MPVLHLDQHMILPESDKGTYTHAHTHDGVELRD